MNKEQEEFMRRNKKIDELCKETKDFGRMQFIDRIADSEIDKDNLIKYLEDKIKEIKDECASLGHLIDKSLWYEFDLKISGYQDVLERIRNNNYD